MPQCPQMNTIVNALLCTLVQVWRRWPSSGWARGCVSAWLPALSRHEVTYAAGTHFEFKEQLDVLGGGVDVSWRDPEALAGSQTAAVGATSWPFCCLLRNIECRFRA